MYSTDDKSNFLDWRHPKPCVYTLAGAQTHRRNQNFYYEIHSLKYRVIFTTGVVNMQKFKSLIFSIVLLLCCTLKGQYLRWSPEYCVTLLLHYGEVWSIYGEVRSIYTSNVHYLHKYQSSIKRDTIQQSNTLKTEVLQGAQQTILSYSAFFLEEKWSHIHCITSL